MNLLPRFLATLLLLPLAPLQAESRPNILLIFTDDHGWADLGAQGVDKDIRTPNLDQLARDGVLFKRGYVTAPQCTPSRAGVISGRYQQRFGVEHNGLAMRQEIVTLPERLQAAGYVTGMSGKWHLDIEDRRKEKGPKSKGVPDLAPQHQGFDEYFTGFLQDYSASHALDGTSFADAPQKVRDERCRVVIQTEAALAFLDRRAPQPGQPWFHYLAWMAPHVPLESPEPWFSQTPAHLPKERRQALALLGAIDDGLGRIRAKLKEMGQEQNTLIFLIADNGAPLGKSWDGSLNLPMRGQKGMLAEGGIRVPFVAAWPGHIPAGQAYDHAVISLDVAATAVALAGAKDIAAQPLDGVNLMPFLTGENQASPHDTLYWRWMSQAAVQEFPWKLIALGNRERLLFDITQPEGEAIERNLMAKHPDIAARLEGKLKAWCDTLQPPGLPTTFDSHHEGLYGEHGIITKPETVAKTKASSEAAPEGRIQGWLCRNGTLAVKDGALIIAPDAKAAPNARPFLTCADIDLPGPITATLRVRARQGGPSTLTWRTKTAGFTPEQSAAFDWPASAEWQEVKVALPEKSRLIHLRITPAKSASEIAVQSIELRGKDGKTQAWRFDAAK
ncbi:MAG: sulfatase [Roseimicrobium sp.]